MNNFFKSTLIVLLMGGLFSCSNTTSSNNSNMEQEVTTVVKPVLPFISRVGEGPIWDYKYNRLLWIDTQGSVFIYTPSNGINKEIKIDKMVGTVVPYSEDTVVVALKDGIYKLNLKTEQLFFLSAPEGGIETNKYNDGKCDSQGRLWVGTMDNNCEPHKANFFVFDGKNSKKVLENVTISNGVAWSLDNKTMYYQDTPTLNVSAFDFDEEKGEISNRREIIHFPENLGTPDGNTIDEEGMLWIANWGAACVTRWNPHTGELLQKIDVPALNVSAVAFGGENLDELYITTASYYMPEDKASHYPEAGKLFVVKPGVKGVKCNYMSFK
ncbi:MAG: SMP-30/gluconolactonase/LRE family protein [Bacteroidales bacterium]|nr:SMP-30/gluconolactonase/LRE family protein [Bacteroidales bacterium]